MNLNLRPMSEAPLNQPILAGYDDGSFQVFSLRGPYMGNATGFYLLSDVLAALDLVRKMTPEGYEFTGEWRTAGQREPWFVGLRAVGTNPGETKLPVPILRKLAEPVEYEYVAEEADRVPREGDYVRDRGAWVTYQDWLKYAIRPYKMDQDKTVALCARRVEVKK